MSVESAILRFRSAALEKGEFHEDSSRDHELHAQMASAWIELESTGETGRLAFSALLEDESNHVRCWVATQLLAHGDESAVSVLRALVSDGGLLGFEAKIVLKEWEADRLKPPFK